MAVVQGSRALVFGPRQARFRSRVAVIALVAVAALTPLPGAASGGPADERLSATLVGRLEPGGEPRLAVRWDGPPGALLDVWVDLDGSGSPEPGELVVEGRPLASGIDVVELDVRPGPATIAEPRLWTRVVEADPDQSTWELPAHPGGGSQQGCAWQDEFFVADLTEPVHALAVYDDGGGPALYAGGEFWEAGGVRVNGIARWDGREWSALSGPSGAGVNGEVYALAVVDDGGGPALYAGGSFTIAGGKRAAFAHSVFRSPGCRGCNGLTFVTLRPAPSCGRGAGGPGWEIPAS